MTTIATNEAVRLDIAVDEAAWEGQFDSLELWRARLSEGGPYEALMGDGWAAARIPTITGDPPSPSQSGPSVPLVGKKLELLIDEKDAVSVTFTGSNPLTFGQAATQIASGSAGKIRSFVLNGRLIVETLTAGASVSLRVVGGDAAPLLNLPTSEPDSVAFGLDARLVLVKGVSAYSYTDKNSSKEFFYKARFYNSADKTVSEFGAPFTGKFIAGVSSSHLVLGYADFVDMNGAARANQELLIYTRADGTIIDGKVVVPSEATRVLTDTTGHVEISLIRGTKVTVAVAGTDLVRDIDVPTDPAITSFNLLDPTKGKNDLFKVQVPQIEYAARRSL